MGGAIEEMDDAQLTDDDLARMQRTPQVKIIRRALGLIQEGFAALWEVHVNEYFSNKKNRNGRTRGFANVVNRLYFSIVLMSCSILSACVPVTKLTIFNMSTYKIFIDTHKDDIVVEPNTDSPPFYVPYFGPGKDWLYISTEFCKIVYKSPNDPSLAKRIEKRHFFGIVVPLIFKDDFSLAFTKSSPIGKHLESVSAEFVLAPISNCTASDP